MNGLPISFDAWKLSTPPYVEPETDVIGRYICDGCGEGSVDVTTTKENDILCMPCFDDYTADNPEESVKKNNPPSEYERYLYRPNTKILPGGVIEVEDEGWAKLNRIANQLFFDVLDTYAEPEDLDLREYYVDGLNTVSGLLAAEAGA